MEPKTPALGKNPEMIFRTQPTTPRQNNHVKKWIANDSAPLAGAVADVCINSVIRGFKGDRAIMA